MHLGPLINIILHQYSLPPSGVHGLSHWARVYENGLHLATLNGADPEVVALFAILHDSQRKIEGEDYDHGQEAADFAQTLREAYIQLDDDRFELLYEACARHTDGETGGDISIQTCWDADRLDLNRVGITPDPARLCTAEARDTDLIAWASARAAADFQPPILDEWFAESGDL